MQIQTVAVGWQVYDLTRDPLDLGLVGLSQFLPALLLVLVTGAVADRFRRRTIMAVCLAIEALCAVALLGFHGDRNQFGLCRSSWSSSSSARRAPSYGPAQQSLLPNIVPPPMLEQRHRAELAELADGHDHRPGRGRPALRHLAGARLRHGRRAALRSRRS